MLAAIVLSCTAAATWLAQDAGNAPQAAAAAAPARKAVLPAPRPKVPEIPSYRVSVRMKTGRRFTGVVSRDRTFHELVYAGAHHGSEVYQRADRFRLRFVDGLDGEIELPWNRIAKLQVRDILDSVGMRVLEQSYASARADRRALAEAPEPPPEDAPDVPAADPAAAKENSGAAKEGAAPPTRPDEKPATLFDEFPPTQGWTPERKKQIEWRRTVVGVFPDARESRFLEVYDEWFKLFEPWSLEQQKKQDAAKSAAPAAKAPAAPATSKEVH